MGALPKLGDGFWTAISRSLPAGDGTDAVVTGAASSFGTTGGFSAEADGKVSLELCECAMMIKATKSRRCDQEMRNETMGEKLMMMVAHRLELCIGSSLSRSPKAVLKRDRHGQRKNLWRDDQMTEYEKDFKTGV